ncbi:FK506-bp2 [Cordylochernes scorpioides]|uniref:peptidylprolyl isomerase n=1 Tax=Cordylochernes scorpioides TaxID=51811 RepID=A0ABY6L9M8_9ARAC|nr:FK506-bp2 [Cordylochernes scorpioides]
MTRLERLGTGSPSGKRQLFVELTGNLENGEMFESSRDLGRPFKFRIGRGEVIKGWDLGLAQVTFSVYFGLRALLYNTGFIMIRHNLDYKHKSVRICYCCCGYGLTCLFLDGDPVPSQAMIIMAMVIMKELCQKQIAQV